MTGHDYEAMLARLPKRQAAPIEPAKDNPQPLPALTRRKVKFDAFVEAALKGVQSSFRHLSTDDIAHPPHHWFDAALARQIAIHLMVTQCAIPKRQIAEEMQRSREAINRALETIENRLVSPDFAATYDAMAARAQAILDGDE